MTRENYQGLYNYIEALYSSKVGAVAKPHSQNEQEERMQVSVYEGMLLGFLLKSINAKFVLEIGTLLGFSTQWLSRAVGSDGEIITIEKSAGAYKRAKEFLDGFGNVKCVNSDAIEYLVNHKFPKKFDAVFIDADKTGYTKYFDLCLPLVRKGGLLIADNTLMFGGVVNDQKDGFREKTLEAIREFNKKVANSNEVESIILPTSSGLTVMVKK